MNTSAEEMAEELKVTVDIMNEGGGGAFPHHHIYRNKDGTVLGETSDLGLSALDYFAAAAIPALIARHRADVPWDRIAPFAYSIAEAMLGERKRRGA